MYHQDDGGIVICVFCFVMCGLVIISPISAGIDYGLCVKNEWKCNAYVFYPTFNFDTKSIPWIFGLGMHNLALEPNTYGTSFVRMLMIVVNVLVFLLVCVFYGLTLLLAILLFSLTVVLMLLIVSSPITIPVCTYKIWKCTRSTQNSRSTVYETI